MASLMRYSIGVPTPLVMRSARCTVTTRANSYPPNSLSSSLTAECTTPPVHRTSTSSTALPSAPS
eukprot:3811151-Pleurochrysis_carterae.AAC.1